MANTLNKVNSGGIEDGSIVNADINASAAIDDSKLGNIGAGKITTGTIATARLGSGSGSSSNYLRGDGSWQAVPAGYDDTNIRQDIAKLALQTAVETNRVGYNLTNSFIDQFEDATKVASATNAIRDSAEYYSTVTSSTHTFSYTGSEQTFTPTAGHTSFVAHIWGAAGAAGWQINGNAREEATGGPGGYTTGTVAITGSPSFKIIVGQSPTPANVTNGYSGAASFGGGGRGHVTSHDGVGGGGGGLSGVFLTSYTHANSVLIAGGGAGSVGHDTHMIPYSGDGGGTSGQDGQLNTGGSHNANGQGHGGSQSAGGGAGSGDYSEATAGSALTGGDGGHMCGGGGGGYYGGGGGNHTNSHGSSGSGGGSGYIGGVTGAAVSSASTSATGSTSNAATIDPPGTGSGHWANNAGRGVYQADGNHGRVVIISSKVDTTGSIESTVSTASDARTKVSGVLLYKDKAGTATLGTDLKISFSCDNGSNWTAVDATAGNYTAGSDFSTGIKTVYIKEMTCTSGTQVKYKVEWANQAANKETQLHGVALNY